MSAAQPQEAPTPNFEQLVEDGFSRARQGAVLVLDARGAQPSWLSRKLAQLVPGGEVLDAGDSLFILLVRHAGPAESWLLVERARRQLKEWGWNRAVMASACWPMQGSSPMDVVAAALASLFDERTRVDAELTKADLQVEVDGSGFWWGAAGELLSG